MAKPKTVLIVNPLTPESRITAQKRAQGYVKQGVATWVKPHCSIRFLRSARRSSLGAEVRRIDHTAIGYDRTDRLILPEETEHVPVVQPMRLYYSAPSAPPSLEQTQPRIDFVNAVWERVRRGNRQPPVKAIGTSGRAPAARWNSAQQI